MAFATIEDLRVQLRKSGATANLDDDSLQAHVDATEQVMTYLIGASDVLAVTELVMVYRSGQAILSRRPLVAITSVARDGSALDHTLAEIIDADGSVVALPFGRGRLTVGYTAGNADILANHTLAAVIIGQHLWRLRNGGGGGRYPGQDDVVVGMGYAVPRRALELLGMEPTPTKVGGIA